jgi:hypothetical protein
MTAPRENPATSSGRESVEVELARLGEQIHSLHAAFEAEKVASKEANQAAFKAAETAVQAALQAQKEAAGKAEESANKQLEMHNVLIRKMDGMVANVPTKEAVQKDVAATFRAVDAVNDRVTMVDRGLARAQGAAAAGIALAGIALAVIATHG